MGKLMTVLAGALMIASILPLTQAVDVDTVHAVVWTRDAAALEARGAHVVEDYGAFLLVEAAEGALPALAGVGLVEPVPTTISKGTVGFDTRDGDVRLPASLQALPEDPHYLVQFIGPIRAEWRAWLATQGDILDYVPHLAWVVRAHPGADLQGHPAVRFVAPFHAAYKLHERLPTDLSDVMDLQLWKGGDVDAVRAQVQALGGEVLGSSTQGIEPYLRVRLSMGQLHALARAPEVAWVEPVLPGDPYDNAQARWVTQSGYPPNPSGNDALLLSIFPAPVGPSVHEKGLSGRGQRIAVADGGIDSSAGRFLHVAFDDPAHGAYQFGQENPAHRKVAGYFRLTEDGVIKGDYVGNTHGTHTSGTTTADAPDGATYGTYNANDGQSYQAKLVVMDWTSLPLDYFNMFDPTYQIGARLHSNSYGYPHDITYNLRARQNDLYTYENPDFLIFRSMGNTAQNTIRPSAVGKDVVSSGATNNGVGYVDIASYSSRGPTHDGRVKPTFVAPGTSVLSTCLGNTYCSISGTSMSTPTSAGAAGLVREYYQDGWYPTGVAGGSPGWNPSSALVRATLINGAVPISGQGTGRPGLASNPLDQGVCVGVNCVSSVTNPKWPNGDMGWGVLRLDNVLAFPGDQHGLWVVDGDSVSTGGTRTYTVEVTKPEAGLKIVLAWVDPAGTVGANPAIVNDLDLKVATPVGLEMMGNVFLGLGGGVPVTAVSNLIANSVPEASGSNQRVQAQSAPGGQPDRINVEEVFVLSYAPAGTYTITVTGANVPQGPQAYAIVAAGGL